MKAMGTVRLPAFKAALAKQKLKSKWFITSDKDAVIMSVKPQEERIVPHLPSQKTFLRQAAHLAITRRGVVVLINCDLHMCADALALARSHGASLSSEPGSIRSYDSIAELQEPVTETTSVLPRLFAAMQLKSREDDPPPPPTSAPVMPFEGPPSPAERRISDYLTIRNDKTLPSWCAVRDGIVHVRRLDLDSVRVIAGAMERSILLQQYESGAYRLHEQATWINERVRVSFSRDPLMVGDAHTKLKRDLGLSCFFHSCRVRRRTGWRAFPGSASTVFWHPILLSWTRLWCGARAR